MAFVPEKLRLVGFRSVALWHWDEDSGESTPPHTGGNRAQTSGVRPSEICARISGRFPEVCVGERSWREGSGDGSRAPWTPRLRQQMRSSALPGCADVL
jgi:hypothetical protein